MIFALLLTILTFQAGAEVNPDDYISDKYIAGEYLIYDCENEHWVCVREVFSSECRDMREEDKLLGKVRARCAPIEQMPTKRSCFQRQLYLISQNYGNRFCLLEPWRHKMIDF